MKGGDGLEMLVLVDDALHFEKSYFDIYFHVDRRCSHGVRMRGSKVARSPSAQSPITDNNYVSQNVVNLGMIIGWVAKM